MEISHSRNIFLIDISKIFNGHLANKLKYISVLFWNPNKGYILYL